MSEHGGRGAEGDAALAKVGRVELALSYVLRTGVMVSSALVTIGAVMALVLILRPSGLIGGREFRLPRRRRRPAVEVRE